MMQRASEIFGSTVLERAPTRVAAMRKGHLSSAARSEAMRSQKAVKQKRSTSSEN